MIDCNTYYELKEYDVDWKDRDLPLRIFEGGGVQFDKGEATVWVLWVDC